MTRTARILQNTACTLVLVLAASGVLAQGGDKALKVQADALFDKGEYAKAYPMYSQLVSLSPQDHELNYKLGACTLYGDGKKVKAIGYLKFATGNPSIPALAWYFLGRAYHLDYQFDEGLAAYAHYKGTADKKLLAQFPVDALEQQCRNGKYLLSNLKDIEVLNKVDVAASDFFRFYDLSDIGGKIVVTPDELLTSMDRKRGERSLVYLPDKGGPIYFSSYGKDGRTGKDIYRSELLPGGRYAAPVKLAGYINTDQDEDYAVMAPDGRTFYFCSKGHNSMGGYDVFRSTYDKGMDAFSAPENMDFAVNTPADEMLYIVGPDAREACFASDRDSRQGAVNVYRVSTVQTPINITVFQGSFSSAPDPADRRARIIVEDDLTRQRVAEAVTNDKGEYVLAVPRGGKYKVLVEAGPGGRSFLTSLEVPPSVKPQAFKQEMELANHGGTGLGVEVKNHFDKPLDTDIMALALDEIRRRARLDVTGERPAAEAQAAATVPADPLQAAGFDGTITMPAAQALARQDATEEAALANEQQQLSADAFELARVNADAAEAQSLRASQLAGSAAGLPPEQKQQLMEQAAEARQRSLEARDRAMAAFQAGTGLATASAASTKRAADAQALAINLDRALAANDKTAATAELVKLKAGIDQRKGPDARPDDLERLRRAASELEEVARKKVARATDQREEEAMLSDRTQRMDNELAAAKGRKREELVRKQAEMKEQATALHQEVEKAFGEAGRAEEAAAVARGEVALVKYLGQSKGGNRTAGTGAPADIVARLAKVQERMDGLNIERQYLPVVASTPEERERRTFDWGGQEALAGNFTPTVRMASSGDRSATAGTQTASVPAALGGVVAAPAAAAATAADVAQAGKEGSGLAQDKESPGAAQGAGASGIAQVQGQAAGNAPPATGKPDDQLASANSSLGAQAASKGGNMPNGAAAAPAPTATAAQPSKQGPATPPAAQPVDPAGTSRGTATEQAAGQEAATDREEQAFLLANKLAELQQLRAAEKDRAVRDSLDRAIVQQKAAVEAFRSGEGVANNAGTKAATPNFEPLEFDVFILDEELAEEAFPGFTSARKEITDGPGTPSEKALRLHALEVQLMDSLEARAQRTLAALEQQPGRAAELLPRVERLRNLKAKHADQAEKDLAEAGQHYAATETKALEDAQLSGRTAAVAGAVPQQNASRTPHNDAYVQVDPDLDRVYASPFAPRTGKAQGAKAEMERDLGMEQAEQAQIDSMEAVLSALLGGKEYDKLRERTDRKIDDLLIHKADLGQRSAFISRSEYAAAQDSAKLLLKQMQKRGFAPDEPLVQMAKGYEEGAAAAMARAKTYRKQADDGRDIFKRNSLYRQAYAEELKALQNMDRSHTVRNYLLGGNASRGEVLSYEEVEQRVYPPVAPNATAPVLVHEPTAPPAASGVVSVEAAKPDAAAKGAVPGAVHAPAADRVDSTTLADYLRRYYYLDDKGRKQVMAGDAESRYFLMKGRSMQVRSDAAAMRNEAEGAQTLANVLGSEATTMRAGAGQGTGAQDADKLQAKADLLKQRSDSLRGAADHLAVSADMIDAQAASLMQALPADKASEIMAMEQAARRTEPVLARSRPSNSEAVTSVLGGKPAGTATMAGAAPAGNPAAKTVRDTAEVAMAPAVPEPVPVEGRTAEAPRRIAPVGTTITSAPAPFAGPLAKDVFTFTEHPAPRQEAIPIDAPMPAGVVYKVQVGAFRNALPVEAFNDMTPLTGERTANGLVRYSAGMFTSAESASQAGAKVRERGYRDAFVVAYMDGRRVPLREAMQAERAALATAAPATAQAAHPVTASGTGQAQQPAPAQAPANLSVPATGDAAEAAVLAAYPATATEVLAAFKPSSTAADYYNDPTAAPAKQVETVKGLFFTVQVGVYSKPTALDKLFNITPLNSERTETGKIRYTTGLFLDEGQAVQRKNGTVGLGVADAFVTAYLNGKRIPVRDARVLLAKFGKAILADPSQANR